MIDVLFDGGHGRPSRTTVGVTLFNYAAFLPECLDSVAAQHEPDLDLIVIDDCSTDVSAAVARTWLDRHQDRFGRARLCQPDANGGLAAARNAILSLADTEFIFMLDADNAIYPRAVTRLEEALDRTTAAFAYGYHQLFEGAIGLTNVVAWSGDLAPGNKVDAMVLIRRAVLAAVGGYSVMPVMGWEDFDLWFKLARRGEWGVLVPEILARYRVHGQSMLRTVTNPNADRLWAYLRQTYPEFFESPPRVRLFDPVRADGSSLVRRTAAADRQSDAAGSLPSTRWR